MLLLGRGLNFEKQKCKQPGVLLAGTPSPYICKQQPKLGTQGKRQFLAQRAKRSWWIVGSKVKQGRWESGDRGSGCPETPHWMSLMRKSISSHWSGPGTARIHKFPSPKLSLLRGLLRRHGVSCDSSLTSWWLSYKVAHCDFSRGV